MESLEALLVLCVMPLQRHAFLTAPLTHTIQAVLLATGSVSIARLQAPTVWSAMEMQRCMELLPLAPAFLDMSNSLIHVQVSKTFIFSFLFITINFRVQH